MSAPAATETPAPVAVVENASAPKVASLDAWKRAKVHTVALPSGVYVEIQIPDLPGMVKTGTIPNELVDVAIGVVQGKEITRDDVVKQAEFYNKLAAVTIVNPAVTEAELEEGVLPFEDKEMIVEFATRQRDVDVLGHHLAGLEKVKDWRTFRGVTDVYEGMEGV